MIDVILEALLHFSIITVLNIFFGVRPTEYLLWVSLMKLLFVQKENREIKQDLKNISRFLN